jgi:FkbM family methyltransferase
MPLGGPENVSLAEWVFDQSLKPAAPGRLSRCQAKWMDRLYRLILKRDPLIQRSFWGITLSMPFSHQLPNILRHFPNYAVNLGRLARYVMDKYPDLRVIDVGANIGDSVAVIRQHGEAPALCLEGDPAYFEILTANLSALRHTRAKQCFVGEIAGTDSMQLEHHSGSAALAPSKDGSVAVQRLPDVLKEETEFLRAKLLKIDTDGYDGKILRGAESYLRSARPVIFFEYDPDMLARQGDDGLSIFGYLGGLGYDGVLIYDNFGDFLLSTNIRETRLLAEIDLYFSGRKSLQYCDVAVVHSDDRDLFDRMRERELEFSKSRKEPHV